MTTTQAATQPAALLSGEEVATALRVYDRYQERAALRARKDGKAWPAERSREALTAEARFLEVHRVGFARLYRPLAGAAGRPASDLLADFNRIDRHAANIEAAADAAMAQALAA